MESAVTTDIRSFAGSIGFLIDRTLYCEKILGTVWLIDDSKVATSAHLLVLYAECLSALKIRFPITGQEHGIAKAVFHPHFNRKLTTQLSLELPAGPISVLPLQKHNVAVLTLTPKPIELTPEAATRLNQKLSLPPPPREEGLGGSLSQIDLALVVLTINNARREGVLTILDERNQPLARLFCKDGRLMYALYNNLVNESAIYQMVNHQITGSFFFKPQHEPDWEVHRAITRPTDMLLIESHRRLDELTKLGAIFGGKDAVLAQAKPDLSLDLLPAELREQVVILWKYLDGTTAANKLWQLANTDNYVIFQALAELFTSHQIIDVHNMTNNSSSGGNGGSEVIYDCRPLPINAKSPLSPWDKLETVVMDPAKGTARKKYGSLLGTMRPLDPWHLLHNLSLLPDATGSPLFKDGQVIGMHCGTVSADSQASDSNVRQMLWAESIYECLTQGTEPELVRRLTLAGEELVRKIAPTQDPKTTEQSPFAAKAGCREVARIDCPRCGSSHLQSARFCKSCGQRLMQDVDFTLTRRPKTAALLTVAITLMIAIAIPAVAWFQSPRPILINEPLVFLPDIPWVDVSLYKAKVLGLTKGNLIQNPAWELVSNNVNINKGDHVHVRITVNDPVYVYVLAKGTTDNPATLIYPDPSVKDVKEKDALLGHGMTFTVPEKTVEVNINKQLAPGKVPKTSLIVATPQQVALGFTPQGPPGTEKIIVMASHSRSALCSQPGQAEDLVEKALSILKKGDFPEGVEVDQSVLGKGLFEHDPFSGKRNRNPVYLQMLNITHD